MSHQFIVTIIVALAYVLLGLLGQTMAIPPGNVTPVWPPSGFALAALIIYGRVVWPGIILGAFIVNTQAFLDVSSISAFIAALLAGISISLGSVLQPIFGDWLLKRQLLEAPLYETPNAFVFFCIATPIICLVSSSIGTLSLYLSNESSSTESLTIWATWWLGDTLGVLLLTPFLLMIHEAKPQVRFSFMKLVTFITLIMTTLFSFGVFFREETSHYPIAFLVLPVLLLFSLRHSRLDTMASVLTLAALATALTYMGKGQFVVDDLNTSLLLLQAFIAITTVTAMTTSILTHNHALTTRQLREENHQRSVSEAELLKLKKTLEEKVTERTEELVLAKNLAEQLARTDPLTNMKNRRAFFEEYQYIYNLAKRYEQTLTVLVIDIDHFKSINDNHGHDFGDHVLRNIANIIMDSIRESEIAARFGGEEFVVLIPQTEANSAKNVAEKIRNNIENHALLFEGEKITVTASIGLTQHKRNNEETMQSIIARADKALYMAKARGRNRVCTL